MTVASYPAAARQDIHENLHGHDVADPYRWLEDPDSEQARAWQSAQDELYAEVLGALPGRERLAARLAELLERGAGQPAGLARRPPVLPAAGGRARSTRCCTPP